MEEEMKPTADTGEMTFDAAIKNLEEIVTRLEEGDTALEEALALFKDGIGLVKICREKLQQAETVVNLLVEKGEGKLEEEAWGNGEGGVR